MIHDGEKLNLKTKGISHWLLLQSKKNDNCAIYSSHWNSILMDFEKFENKHKLAYGPHNSFTSNS